MIRRSLSSTRATPLPFAILALSALAAVPAPAVSQRPAADGATAFVNVNVIPMDSERVLRDRTVVVRDGRIAALGPAATTPVPAGARRVDGHGRYLIPGLAEMHGHLPFQEGALAENTLFLYLAGGVTTVRGMQGHPVQLDLRRRVEAGELAGPRLWLAAPGLSGNSAPDPATAERLVREHAAAGYDLLKIHEGLSPGTYRAIVRTAAEVGIPLGGHVPDAVGLRAALAAGQGTVDHLDNYLDELQPAGSPARDATGMARQMLLARHVDEALIPELVRATREAGVAVVPTMPLWEVLRGHRETDELMMRDELRYWPPEAVRNWATANTNRRRAVDPALAARHIEVRNRLLRALSDEGVTILLGSDAPQQFSIPGFSIHREMQTMVDAGMTPYQVLRSGTVNVAEHLDVGDRAGTIAPGRWADLVLLDANPLDDIRHAERRAGVMVRGVWLPREEIERRLAAIEAGYR